MEYTGYALSGDAIDAKAKLYLEYLTGRGLGATDAGEAITIASKNAADNPFRYDSTDYDGYAAISTDKSGKKGVLNIEKKDDIDANRSNLTSSAPIGSTT